MILLTGINYKKQQQYKYPGGNSDISFEWHNIQ
jgi:hypothetical protein